MTYKILIVEDDKGISAAVKDCLKSWEMQVETIKDFRSITAEFCKFNPHLVLMDILLPFMDGYYWCREIRKISNVPIIFISSASDNMNIVMAMNMGGDDFIAKPFDSSVLVAKIQALLRRSYDFAATLSFLSYKGAVLDTSNNSLIYNNEKVELTKNEYRILLCLMENKEKIVSREHLMEKLWESDAFVDDNTLTVNINRLRKKLAGVGLCDFITTKVGVGYMVK